MRAVFFILIMIIAVQLNAEASSDASIGGGFALTTQDGNTLSDSDLYGKYRLVFFGFTHCPDICPTSLLAITQALKKLGDNKTKVVSLFITVDPEQDMPEKMKLFLANFDSGIIGLTGSKEQIEKVEKEYKVYAGKIPDGIEHSGTIYFMDPQGKYLTVFTGDLSPESMVDKIKGYIN